jgi:hypothetical protein
VLDWIGGFLLHGGRELRIVVLSVESVRRQMMTSSCRNRDSLLIDALNRFPSGWQLEHRCALAFGQMSEQHDLAARKFQGIVMRAGIT